MTDCEQCRALQAENRRAWKLAEELREAVDKALETADAYRDIYALRQEELEEARAVARDLWLYANNQAPPGTLNRISATAGWLKETP